MAEDYSGYKWIKVKHYKMDESLSWEERYHQLEQHHIEETTFLIETVRELANAQSNVFNVPVASEPRGTEGDHGDC
jgi:hypothetical protein